MKGDSTTQPLLYINHLIKSSWTKGEKNQSCFLDVYAAFYKCWVNGILEKLSPNKDDGSCHDLFKSYLTNQKNFIVIDGCKSEVLEITAGVPQRSWVGPLLLIIFLTDILDDHE